MRTTDWEFDFASLPRWDIRERIPFVYDEFFEVPGKDMLCCIYSVAEVSMMNYEGFLAILRNKQKPELVLNVTDISFCVNFSHSKDGNLLFLQPSFYSPEKGYRRPVMILDMEKGRYSYIKKETFPPSRWQIGKPWRKWQPMENLKHRFEKERNPMIYTVTLNPALDKTVEIPDFKLGSVNRITALRTDPGGKGINVSKVIAALGGESEALGILGGDTGKVIVNKLLEMGLRFNFAFVSGETRTNLKVVDPICHTCTDINEPGVPVEIAQLEHVLQELTDAIRPGDIVVLSGSLPKGAPTDTYRRFTERCQNAGAKVFLDADGDAMKEGVKAKPYLIKPNEHELSRLLGKELTTVEQLLDGARELLAEGVQMAVVSMGKRGALYVTEAETIFAEGLDVPVLSTVGAGDSVVAALALGVSRGCSLEEIAVLSTATGAANVMCSGTQAADRETVETLMPKVVIHKL